MPTSLLGFPVDNVTMGEAVDDLLGLMKSTGAHHVSFLNAHYVNVASRRRDYGAALRSVDRLFADGSGLRLAARLSGLELRDNVNGTDLFPPLVTAMAGEGLRIFMLGGRPGVAEEVRARLLRSVPDLEVCGCVHGYHSPEETGAVLDQIRTASPHLLLVGMGAPHQDLWIRRHRAELDVPVVMAVGRLFDFYSGRIPRAPAWMRASGLEWVYRLYREPTRMWRRYLVGNVTFLARALGWASGLVGPERAR